MHAADAVLTIILIVAFAASVLLVLLFGTRIYRSMSAGAESAYDERTCAAYLAEKLRHGDERGAVRLGSFDGAEALYIDSEYDGVVYSQILYCYDGWVWELLCEKDAVFSKTDGTKLIPARAVQFSEPSPGLFYIEAVGLDGEVGGLYVSLRSGG
jgi:hypothetical protein